MALTKENITRELLEKVAADLNKTILDAESAIPIDGVMEDAFRADVLEVGGMLIAGDVSKLKPETGEVLGAMGIELFVEVKGTDEKEEIVEPPESTVDNKEETVSKPKPEKEDKTEIPKTLNKKSIPGVIVSILEFIQKAPKEGINIKEIANKLTKRFPDRKADAMMKTIRAQIGGKKTPTRMEKEKKVEFSISDGKYSIS